MTYKLSPHSLNLYAECPRCFYETVAEKKGRPSGPFPSLPSGMDLIIKKRFDSFRKSGKLPPELKSLERLTLFTGDVLKEWRNQRKGMLWTVEDENSLTGSVDEILQSSNGNLIVMDNKTRGFPLKDTPKYYRLQLDLYNLMLRKNGYKTEDYSVLLFFYPDSFNRSGSVKFNNTIVKFPVDVVSAEKTFRDALTLLKGKKPLASEECKFCEWKNKK
jgi:hypothetical protein